MEFNIDNDGQVCVDGVRNPDYKVAEDILHIPNVTVMEEPVVYGEANVSTGLKESVFRSTSVTYPGIVVTAIETASLEEIGVDGVEESFRQGTPRRLIVALQQVADSLAVQWVPAAIESSFVKDVFITLPPFD